ncbi:alpha/beta hydrolase fold domain-containing protein [Sulfitobacter sp. S190]|uniref:alpha/beta hydrolase fold domain-containing protein n=1 Tax=Sulfitobacter sp. S190 TaxID=2867022 RepID=UPI0021A2E19C|nr:alpha/beta hydrolase [Sulfitobacter sp. S190]UWR22097.1 alpha/beta hydrolase [Sulfitobacter sp. S190]
MSLRARVLNIWLRHIERPKLERANDPVQLRRSLERQARYFFHSPRGTSHAATLLGNIDAIRVLPRIVQKNRLLFYIHGGGFLFGSPETHAALAAQLARRLQAPAVLPRYRLAPEQTYPAAPEDVRHAWDGLMAQGVDPGTVVLGGDSAGGALAFGLLASLCADGAPLPGAVFGFSPLADLAYESDSVLRNAPRDAILPGARAPELAQMFLGGAPADDPRVSPCKGTFPDAPPAWITVGDTEILLDDARRLAAALRRDGAEVEFREKHDLPHVWPILHNFLPEARETLDELAAWIRRQQGWANES